MNQVGTLHQNFAKNKTVQVFMYKKNTINFSTSAQFHYQIQKKENEFCHYDIDEG